jgi:eukaryotic-like serine/threonine-protein kinase
MSAQPATAEIIGNYMIERSLAQGSMGHVYVARHQLTYARVALKVLRSELAAETNAEERFLREVRAAAQIGHDGIVKVLDAGCDQHGRLYLAMELLSGETLEERMARDPGDRLALMHWVAHALPPLAAAHGQGIIHRDLKPANLFIAIAQDGSEQLKLLDFGLARDTRQKSRTETGVALGTPYYMSPEQAMRPKEVGPATDVWALGVMMYEVLSGQMPFDGETLHAVVLQSSTRPHVPLATREPNLDPALCELVEDCLCKDPDLRPHDANALLARLYPLLEDPGVNDQLERPLSSPRVTSSSSGRTPRAADAISYADTAITLPAPRLDASEASYAPRRSANTSVLVPVVLSIALVGGGFVGYLRFAPALQQQAAATAPPTAAAAVAPAQAQAQAAPAQPVQQAPAAQPAQPVANNTPAALPTTESNTSAARDARAAAVQAAAKPSKRDKASRKRSNQVELPLPNIAVPQDLIEREVSANGPAPRPEPETPADRAEWDAVDTHVNALPGQVPEPEVAPLAPEAQQAEAQQLQPSAAAESGALAPPEPAIDL